MNGISCSSYRWSRTQGPKDLLDSTEKLSDAGGQIYDKSIQKAKLKSKSVLFEDTEDDVERLRGLAEKLKKCNAELLSFMEHPLITDLLCEKESSDHVNSPATSLSELKSRTAVLLHDQQKNFGREEIAVPDNMKKSDVIVKKTCGNCQRVFNGPKSAVNPRYAAHSRYCKQNESTPGKTKITEITKIHDIRATDGIAAMEENMEDSSEAAVGQGRGQPVDLDPQADTKSACLDRNPSKDSFKSEETLKKNREQRLDGINQMSEDIAVTEQPIIDIEPVTVDSAPSQNPSTELQKIQNEAEVCETTVHVPSVGTGVDQNCKASDSRTLILTPVNKRPSKLGRKLVQNAVLKFHANGDD